MLLCTTKNSMPTGLPFSMLLLDVGGPMRGNKQPDWLCRECQNKNFGWREVCNRCQVREPLQSDFLKRGL